MLALLGFFPVEVRLSACGGIFLFLAYIKATAVIVAVVPVLVAGSDALLKVEPATGVELHEIAATLGDVAVLKQKIPHSILVGL